MKRCVIFFVSIAVVAVIASVQATPAQEIQEKPITLQQAALKDGQALYGELCAVCHGVDGKGQGPAAPALSKPAPDLTQLASGNGGEFPAAEVQKAITGQVPVTAHGTLEMPMWGKVFEDARHDLKPGQRWGSARLRILAWTEHLESIQVEMELK